LKKDVEKHVKQVREDALAQVGKLQRRMNDMPEYSALNTEQKQEIEQSFTTVQDYIQNENLISSIRDRAGRYEANDYNSLLNKITALTTKGDEEPAEYISQSELDVKFDQTYLASEEDVAGYLDALKKALLKAIKGNKRIRL
jgi:hypothetical protein